MLESKELSHELSAGKQALKLALPMAGSRFLAILSNFIGMALIAHLSHTVLAASALIYATQTAVLVFGMSLLFSTSAMVGQSFGAKKYEAIGPIVQQAWVLALLLSMPIMLVFAHVETVLTWFHQKPELIAIAKQYFSVYLWCIPPLMLMVTNIQAMYGVLKQKIVVYLSIQNLILVPLLSYVLIYGKFGFSPQGVKGLALANVIYLWTLGIAVQMLVLIKHPYFKDFKLFDWQLRNIPLLKKLFHIGWPIALQTGGELFYFLTVTMMIGWLGNEALAANQVVRQYLFLLIVPIFSLSQASGVLVSQAFGRKNFENMKIFNHTSLHIAYVLTTVLGGALILMPEQFSRLFMNIHNPANHPTLVLVGWLFVVVIVNEYFDATRNIITGSLRGLYDTKYPMIVSLICIWGLSLPCAYYFGFKLHWGVIGVTMGFGVGAFVGMLLMWRRWHSKVASLMA